MKSEVVFKQSPNRYPINPGTFHTYLSRNECALQMTAALLNGLSHLNFLLFFALFVQNAHKDVIFVDIETADCSHNDNF